MSISAEVSEMNISKDDLEDDLKNLGDDLEDDLENILEEIDSKEIANFPNEAYGSLCFVTNSIKLPYASFGKFAISFESISSKMFSKSSFKSSPKFFKSSFKSSFEIFISDTSAEIDML